jgi:hypothetical protein
MLLPTDLLTGHALTAAQTHTFTLVPQGISLFTVTETVTHEVALFLITPGANGVILGIGDTGSAFVVSAAPTAAQFGVSLVAATGVVTITTGSAATGTFKVDFISLDRMNDKVAE